MKNPNPLEPAVRRRVRRRGTALAAVHLGCDLWRGRRGNRLVTLAVLILMLLALLGGAASVAVPAGIYSVL